MSDRAGAERDVWKHRFVNELYALCDKNGGDKPSLLDAFQIAAIDLRIAGVDADPVKQAATFYYEPKV